MLTVQQSYMFLLFCLLLIVNCCNNNIGESKLRGGPYYYKRFAFNYQIPFKPMEEISEKEAKSYVTYYVAYFSNDGKIISFTKYLKGKMAFSENYAYNTEGLLERRESTDSKGEITFDYFDKNGKIITGANGGSGGTIPNSKK